MFEYHIWYGTGSGGRRGDVISADFTNIFIIVSNNQCFGTERDGLPPLRMVPLRQALLTVVGRLAWARRLHLLLLSAHPHHRSPTSVPLHSQATASPHLLTMRPVSPRERLYAFHTPECIARYRTIYL